MPSALATALEAAFGNPAATPPTSPATAAAAAEGMANAINDYASTSRNHVMARISSDQTGIVRLTNTPIIFNTEDRDPDSAYNNATGYYTAPATGIYLAAWAVIFGQVTYAAATYVEARLSVNGSTSAGGLFSAHRYETALANEYVAAHPSGTAIVYLTAGQTIHISARHSHSANLTALAGTWSYFHVLRLG